jgi:hypothetical protein
MKVMQSRTVDGRECHLRAAAGCAVIPVVLKDEVTTVPFARWLHNHGILAAPLLFPTVLQGFRAAPALRYSGPRDWRVVVVYSVVFRYPTDYILRKDGSLFGLLRMRCGHQHLTIRSAAECKDRLARGPKGIRYIIGRFGRVEDTATHRVLTDAEIRKARATELDIVEAFKTVLALARERITSAKTKTGERARQTAACDIVEKFVVRLR